MKIIRIENKNENECIIIDEGKESKLNTSIHMFFVYMDLAVIWINSGHTVVDTILARSWRPAYAPRQAARYILEIHPSRLNEFTIGDQVEFQNV